MFKIVADNKIIELSEDEWMFVKTLLEDSMKFHAAVYQEFREFAPDLTNEYFDASRDSDFEKNKTLFKRLKEFGLDVFGLDV